MQDYKKSTDKSYEYISEFGTGAFWNILAYAWNNIRMDRLE